MVEPLLRTLQALQPLHGAVFCLSLCRIRGPGAWALKDRCEEDQRLKTQKIKARDAPTDMDLAKMKGRYRDATSVSRRRALLGVHKA